jgi:hypothetical protein
LKHEGTKPARRGHEGKKEEGLAVCGPLRGSCFATPCGSKQLVPFRSELLRAQSVSIRRLRRLAKLFAWAESRRQKSGVRIQGGDLDLRFSVDYLLVWGRLDW